MIIAVGFFPAASAAWLYSLINRLVFSSVVLGVVTIASPMFAARRALTRALAPIQMGG